MNAEPFLDTNVLVYAFSDAPHTVKAESLVMDGGIISVQVLNEFVRVMRQKQRKRWNEIHQMNAVVRALLSPPLPLTLEMHDKAVMLAERFGLEFFDCVIVAAALEAGCTTLYTEDLQHGQVVDGLTIRNPFIS
ncbi:MAG TPA: PIN domain-containing protein [Rhizomicrobium sp.]|jgi:predicted nucleic acid-binding protein|nr:PIN domain-containing protein [Rhizomicrobium sp.]